MNLSAADKAALERQMLGWGPIAQTFGPDITMDIVLSDGPGPRDLTIATGMDCLVQDLRVALTTALGADPLNADFGFDGVRALAEETDPILQRERIRGALVRVLQRDPRVRRVIDVRIGQEVTAAEGNVAPPIGVLPATVQFATIVGDTATVSVGGVQP